MSITAFLRNQAFDPETLTLMADVYEEACAALGLAERNGPLNEIIAGRVIELAQRGVRTPTALYMMTVQGFKHPV